MHPINAQFFPPVIFTVAFSLPSFEIFASSFQRRFQHKRLGSLMKFNHKAVTESCEHMFAVNSFPLVGGS